MTFRTLYTWLSSYRFYTLHLRSLEAMQHWQDGSLRRLAKHAYATVPLWKEIFTNAHMSPDSIRNVKDLARLPVTNKQTYVRKTVEEYTDNSRLLWIRWHSTSGSTGTPFTFLNRRIGYRYDDFSRIRFLLWKQVLPMNLSRIRVARVKMTPEQRERRLFVPLGSYRDDPHSVLKQLASFKPTVLESYATVLLDMAQLVRANPELEFAIPYITSYGEKLTDAARDYIERAFTAEVYDRYGIEEIGVMAIECGKHDGQHIYGESVIVEIVNTEGAPLPPGGHGHIVVTDLLNYNMPFIRYDTGDRGMMSTSPCPCGLQTPRLWFDGRYSASLTLGGKKFHHLEFDEALHAFMNSILQYQIVKTTDESICVRIVAGHGFSTNIREMVLKKMNDLLGSHIAIDVKTVDTLSTTPRGKSRTLIDETA